jgi:hypothetical protein
MRLDTNLKERDAAVVRTADTAYVTRTTEASAARRHHAAEAELFRVT